MKLVFLSPQRDPGSVVDTLIFDPQNFVKWVAILCLFSEVKIIGWIIGEKTKVKPKNELTTQSTCHAIFSGEELTGLSLNILPTNTKREPFYTQFMVSKVTQFLKRIVTIPIFKSGKDLFTMSTLPTIVTFSIFMA